jgi:hypothetical protein
MLYVKRKNYTIYGIATEMQLGEPKRGSRGPQWGMAPVRGHIIGSDEWALAEYNKIGSYPANRRYSLF